MSAGIGVTPLLAMLHAATNDDRSSREVWWFHSARDGAHHPFADQLRVLMKALRRGRLCNIYSRPATSDRLGVDYDVRGHVDVALLRQLSVPKGADFYLCGPAGFLADLV